MHLLPSGTHPPLNSSDPASYHQAPQGVKESCERPGPDIVQGLGFLSPKNAFLAGRCGAARP